MSASSSSRYYTEAVLKKLFALSRNRCAFPVCEEELAKPEWLRVLAEICHIAGLNVGSARHDPTMTDAQRNDFPNLLLLCPNHHQRIDVLEPERWGVDDLYGMKVAHESTRRGDQPWCSDELAEQFVAKLVLTRGLKLVAAGQQRREPIRSGTPPPHDPLPPREPQRPARDRTGFVVADNPDWPRGSKRVRDLANELGMETRAVLELCEVLGIPAHNKDRTLSEPYADMVRRRARRDGLSRPAAKQAG